MSENKIVKKPRKKKVSPTNKHPTPVQRMEFVKWFLRDDIQEKYKDIVRYKMRDKVIEDYFNEFKIKIGVQFMVELDEGKLTKTIVDGEEEYKLAKEFVNSDGEAITFCLKEYCLHPFKLLKKMQKIKRQHFTNR